MKVCALEERGLFVKVCRCMCVCVCVCLCVSVYPFYFVQSNLLPPTPSVFVKLLMLGCCLHDQLPLALAGAEDLLGAAFSWLILRITEDWRLCVWGQLTPPRHLFKAPETGAALWAAVPRARHLSRGLAEGASARQNQNKGSLCGQLSLRGPAVFKWVQNHKPIVLSQHAKV